MRGIADHAQHGLKQAVNFLHSETLISGPKNVNNVYSEIHCIYDNMQILKTGKFDVTSAYTVSHVYTSFPPAKTRRSLSSHDRLIHRIRCIDFRVKMNSK